MSEERKLTLLCGLIKSLNPTIEEVSESLAQIVDRDRLLWVSESPLICSVVQGRQDLVELMINEFQINVNSICAEQDRDCWCALQAAVASKNYELAKFLVINLGANVDLVLLRTSGPDQSILTSSIGTGNADLVEFLMRDLEANVDKDLWHRLAANPNDDKHFFPLLCAIQEDMKKDFLERDWTLTKLLLYWDVDLSKEGWIKIAEQWIFGTAVQVARELGRIRPPEERNSFQDLVKLLNETRARRDRDQICATRFQNQKARDLFTILNDDVTSLDATLQTTRQKIRCIELKLKDGQNKLAHKRTFHQKLDYLVVHEASEARLREREVIAAARTIHSDIEVARSDSNFLDDETIVKLSGVLESEKSRRIASKRFQSQQKLAQELECNICMEIPQSGAMVRCCINDHILCNACCSRVDFCPLCRENFQTNKPRRSLFAERMISVYHETSISSLPDEVVPDQSEELFQTLCDALLTHSSVNDDNDDDDFERLDSKLRSAKEIQGRIKGLESSPNFLTLPDLETRELREEIRASSLCEVENLLEFLDGDDQEFREETEIETLKDDLETTKEKLRRILLDLPAENEIFGLAISSVGDEDEVLDLNVVHDDDDEVEHEEEGYQDVQLNDDVDGAAGLLDDREEFFEVPTFEQKETFEQNDDDDSNIRDSGKVSCNQQ